MGVSINEVQELRSQTGAGILDCKNALIEANGDMQKAKEVLRIRGLDKLQKKSGRETLDGLVALRYKSEHGVAIAHLSSETDFVAKNDKFQKLVSDTLQLAVENMGSSKEALLEMILGNSGETLGNEIARMVSVMGENIVLRAVDYLFVQNGIIASYVHNMVDDNVGKIVSAVAIECDEEDKDAMRTFGRQIAMHIAAKAPMSLHVDNLDPEVVQKERAIICEQMAGSGKPAAVIEKIVSGRLQKFFEETVLLEQIFVVDGLTRIGELMAQYKKSGNIQPKIIDYKFYKIGNK